MATNNSENSSASQNNTATNQRIPSNVKFRGITNYHFYSGYYSLEHN